MDADVHMWMRWMQNSQTFLKTLGRQNSKNIEIWCPMWFRNGPCIQQLAKRFSRFTVWSGCSVQYCWKAPSKTLSFKEFRIALVFHLISHYSTDTGVLSPTTLNPYVYLWMNVKILLGFNFGRRKPCLYQIYFNFLSKMDVRLYAVFCHYSLMDVKVVGSVHSCSFRSNISLQKDCMIMAFMSIFCVIRHAINKNRPNCRGATYRDHLRLAVTRRFALHIFQYVEQSHSDYENVF